MKRREFAFSMAFAGAVPIARAGHLPYIAELKCGSAPNRSPGPKFSRT